MKLTRIERLLLANQYRILEAVGPQEERDSYAHFREALERGYEGFYDTIVQNVYPEGLTEAECREVADALQMFDMLGASYDNLGATDKAAIKPYDVQFHGYDGNNETSFMTYTEFFTGEDRYTNVVASREFNSHAPMRSRYQAMRREFEKVPAERWGKMTKDEINAITSAR